MRSLRKVTAVLLVAWLALMAMPVNGEGAPIRNDEISNEEDLPSPDPLGMGEGHFTENLGQWRSHVSFVADSTFGQAVFDPEGVMYDVKGDGYGHRVKVNFAAEEPVDPVGIGDLGYDSNYFFGNDPDGWVTGARSYREVLYQDVWPGIDVRYYFQGRTLKYDVIVGARADPSPVGFTVDGAQGLDVAADRMDISLSRGMALQDRDLVAFYEDGEAVDIRFDENGPRGFGFDVDKAPGRTLIIDPVVSHASTFFGGTYDEWAADVAVDPDGNIYISGTTGSSDYPVTTGAYCETMQSYDIIVTKLNYNCSEVIWSSFLGGTSTDFICGIELDDENNVYVAGDTWSKDFPMTQDAWQDKFNLGMNAYGPDIWVTKFKPDGDDLVFSTYVGGSGPEKAGDFKLWKGQPTVVGWTDSKDFPTDKGMFGSIHGDAFFSMLNAKGSAMVAFQYWGGYSSEMANALEFDSNGDAIVGGRTSSMDFFTTPGVYQEVRPSFASGFVSRYSPSDDVIEFSTYLGGAHDSVTAITVDEDRFIYIAGWSWYSGPGTTFPVTPGAFDTQYNGATEGLICKMDPDGTRLVYSTLLGGDGADDIYDIHVEEDGTVTVVGELTSSGNFTVTEDALDGEFKGDSEGFVFTLNADGTAPVYSSYHGGSYADAIFGMAKTEWDNTVLAGSSSSVDLTINEDAFQRKLEGDTDALVAVIGDLAPTTAPLDLVAVGREGFIGLVWDEPLEDGGYPVLKYLIYRGTSPDDLSLYKVLGDHTGIFDRDVEWGVEYHYAVQAWNGKGRSPLSNVASARSVTVPDPPLNMTGTVLEDRIALEWEAPEFTGGLPITGYNLYRGTPTSPMELLAEISDFPTAYEDNDLVDRTLYSYQLAAVTEYGESTARCYITLRATGVPTPPLDLNHTYGDLFIRLTWQRPADEYGLPVERYLVYREDPEGLVELVTPVAPPRRHMVDTEVEVGTVYTYTVTAVNAKGESAPCTPIDAKAMVRPDPPEGTEAMIGEHFVRVTWSPPGFDGASSVLGYRVYLGDKMGEAEHIGGVNAESRPDAPLVFLHDVAYDGVQRHYLVTAVNAEGESDPSPVASTSALEVPGAPRALEVVWGDGVLTLEWTAPETDGGVAVLTYSLYRMSMGAPWSLLVTLPDGMGRYVDDDVENGVEYTYRVTATNMVGESGPSLVASAVPAGLPQSPLAVAAQGLSDSVRVTWVAPENTGGRAIDGYRIYGISEDLEIELLAEIGPGIKEHIHLDLDNGQAYVYALQAFTEAGESELSEFVEATPVGPPSMPQGLVVLWSEGHVYVAWSAPTDDGGTPITGYRLHRHDWDPGNWTELTTADIAYRDYDVEPGGTYNYTVHAMNGVGDGPVTTVTITIPEPKESPQESSSTNYWPMLVVCLVLVTVAVVTLSTRGRRGAVE
jgi:fibronectin type 3 domain-containing protein